LNYERHPDVAWIVDTLRAMASLGVIRVPSSIMGVHALDRAPKPYIGWSLSHHREELKSERTGCTQVRNDLNIRSATMPPASSTNDTSQHHTAPHPLAAMSASASASSNGVLTQNLLKRRAGTTIEEFRKHYIERHGKLAIPWFLANGVTYYAQVSIVPTPRWSPPRNDRHQDPDPRGVRFQTCSPRSISQIHRPLHWTSSSAREKYESTIHLDDWDAIGEVAFAEGYGTFSNAPAYYQEVILPDERRFLLDEAFKHMKVVDADCVVGERIEFIVGGKAVVEYEEWRGVFGGYDGKR